MSYEFIPALRFHDANRTNIRYLVIHTMEAPLGPATARNCAAWFQNHSAPVVSAHYCVDEVGVIQCVLDKDIAFHAPPNDLSVGIELAGHASQTPEQWAGESAVSTLQHAAKLCAELCERYSIPIVWLGPKELISGLQGITGHGMVSAAFHQSSHTDPGPNFPVETFLAMVSACQTLP